jgi:hypothetical protein
MNYSFNADYRAVAKRLAACNTIRLFSGTKLWTKWLYVVRLKWPWC